MHISRIIPSTVFLHEEVIIPWPNVVMYSMDYKDYLQAVITITNRHVLVLWAQHNGMIFHRSRDQKWTECVLLTYCVMRDRKCCYLLCYLFWVHNAYQFGNILCFCLFNKQPKFFFHGCVVLRPNDCTKLSKIYNLFLVSNYHNFRGKLSLFRCDCNASRWARA